jgi:hypothetical protein
MIRTIATTPADTPGSSRTRKSKRGSRPREQTARSTATNATNAHKQLAGHAHVQVGQPASRPNVSGVTSASSAAPNTPAPSRSSRRGGPAGIGGSRRRAVTSSSAPTGALINSAGRQASATRFEPTSSPPTTCPAATPTARISEQAPIARARDSPSNSTWMIESTWGVMRAPAAPWKARAAMSAEGLGASLPASDASVKPASPIRNARRRSSTSPSRAPITTSAAKTSVYIATTSCNSASEACRLSRRLGAATARIDPSMDAIAWPAKRIESVTTIQKAADRAPIRLGHLCASANLHWC